MGNSIEIWIKPNKTNFVIIEKNGNEIKVDSDGNIDIYFSELGDRYSSINKVNIGEWNQIILINDHNSMYIYINSEFSDIMFPNELIDLNHFTNIENHNVKIGGGYGEFGSFVVYPRVFTIEDIKSLYSTGIARYQPPKSTVTPTKKSLLGAALKEAEDVEESFDELNELDELYIMYLHTYTAIRITASNNQNDSSHDLEETLNELEKCAKEDFDKVIGMTIFAMACNDNKILSFKLFQKIVDEMKKEL